MCYPGNQDDFQTELKAIARTLSGVLTTAAAKNVILVKSAGNQRDEFCVRPSTGEPAAVCKIGQDRLMDTDVQKMNAFAMADAMTPTVVDPLLIVEAYAADGSPADFSQLGGDIAAPGVAIVSTMAGGTYGPDDGTSMAAPHVTGALAYLYSVKPSADWRSYRQAILSSARNVGLGGASHLDLFGAEVNLNMLKSAVDQNDWSADGDRRVFRSDLGTSLGLDTTGTTAVDGRDGDLGPGRAQPDGKIDMRDFRAMRDAWLQTCLDGSAGTQAGSAPACPAQITLDGPADHLKKDGNGDRCVATPTTSCQLDEAAYSRFDANGDGQLSVWTKAPLKVDGQGRPATTTPVADRPGGAAGLLRDERQQHRGVGEGRAAQPAGLGRPRRPPRRLLGRRGDERPGDHDGRRSAGRQDAHVRQADERRRWRDRHRAGGRRRLDGRACSPPPPVPTASR